MRNNFNIEVPSVIDLDMTKKVGNVYIVDKHQPISIHKAIEKYSIYFKREFRFDHSQYSAHSDFDQANSKSYIWIYEDWDDIFLTGAANFRFLGDIGQCNNWSLEWVWFHPYFRNKGHLSAAWPYFVKKFGKNFRIEPPLSKPMENFLLKLAINK